MIAYDIDNDEDPDGCHWCTEGIAVFHTEVDYECWIMQLYG